MKALDGADESQHAAERPVAFSLSRWFSTIGLISIVTLAVVSAFLLSRLLEHRMLLQDGQLTQQFVQSIIDVENAASYFESPQPEDSSYLEQLLAQIARSPDVLRANLYSRDRQVIWSSDPVLTGRSFAGQPNGELDVALAGGLEVHEETPQEEGLRKAEHSNLPSQAEYFIEVYVPVRTPARDDVVGVVELYRAAGLLHETIASGQRLIWACALGAAALLFVALLPLVRRADAMIADQQGRLADAQALAAIGDLGAAVAHGVRNPLSVIRTSAEIMRDGSPGVSVRDAASDIMDQVDRLERWVRELLTYVHLPAGERGPVDVNAVARDCLERFAVEMRRRSIVTAVDLPAGMPRVRGDAILLGQLLSSLIANAVEAMSDGGRLAVMANAEERGMVAIELRDTGPGMTEQQLAGAFRPFHTTKAQGLGVGLPLARRIVRRMGGDIALESRAGEGTTARLMLPVAGR